MEIKGQLILLSDNPRDSSSDTFFRWFNLEEWMYFNVPDQPFQPVSREVFDQRAKKNEERYNEKKQDESRPSPGLHIDTLDGQHIGWVSVYNWDPQEKSTFIGISIPEEEHWGKGYGTEAVSLHIDYLFDSFDLETIKTATWTGNIGMVRCAQKAGFKNYQLMPHRSPTSVRGEPLERIEFTLTKEEWSGNRDSS
jgi:RimJ/RimL family protein N-acetyltransferase